MHTLSRAIAALILFPTCMWATVTITSPANYAKVSSPVLFEAKGSAATCKKGVASMVLTVDGKTVYSVAASAIDTSLVLAAGKHAVAIHELDQCGKSADTTRTISVTDPIPTKLLVSSPVNHSTVASPVNFVATAAATTCAAGMASIRVYSGKTLLASQSGATLNQRVSLGNGVHSTNVIALDKCGGSLSAPVSVTVKTPQPTKVVVASPANNSQAQSPVNFVATATTGTCAAGIESVGVYSGGQLLASQTGASFNGEVTLPVGVQTATVEALDNCGRTASTPVSFTVEGQPSSLSNLQADTGWESYGQLPPKYVDCSPCSGFSWAMTQGIATPSQSGDATEFDTSGTVPFAVALWVDPVLGSYSTHGLPDKSHTLIPTLYHFTYDTDFYVTNASIVQALEFDVAMYLNGAGMFWGTQCAAGGDGDWDMLDKGAKGWVSSGVPCELANGWNHLTLNFQRAPGNKLLYQSVTLNGVTSTLNITYPSQAVSTSWYGVTVNYQMDGNRQQASDTTYLDNLTLTYW
jgi:hypothetical protein